MYAKIVFFAYMEGSALEYCAEAHECPDDINYEELSNRSDDFANRIEDVYGGHAISYGYKFI